MLYYLWGREDHMYCFSVFHCREIIVVGWLSARQLRSMRRLTRSFIQHAVKQPCWEQKCNPHQTPVQLGNPIDVGR